MEPMTRRSRRRIIALAGVLAVASVAALVWVNRVELFLVPPVWREVREELAALRASGAPRVDGAFFSKRLEGRLRELLGLQDAALGRTMSHFLHDVRDDQGDDVYVIACIAPREDGGHREVVRVVDERGVLRPDGVLPETSTPGLARDSAVSPALGFGLIPPTGRVERHGPWGAVLSFPLDRGRLEVGVDGRGLFPRGAVLPLYGQPYVSTWIEVSPALDAAVEDWEEYEWVVGDGGLWVEPQSWRRSAPLRPVEPTASHGHLFRFLHAVEVRGAAEAHRARFLIAHPDPDIRARAASVLGNDREQGPAFAGLLDDPSPRVRDTASLALLFTADAELAARGFIALLESKRWGLLPAVTGSFRVTRADGSVRDVVHPDFRRLRSARVAGALVAFIEREACLPFSETAMSPAIDAFESGDVAPLAPRLIALLERDILDPGARSAVARWLVTAGDPAGNAALASFRRASIERATRPASPRAGGFPLLRRARSSGYRRGRWPRAGLGEMPRRSRGFRGRARGDHGR